MSSRAWAEVLPPWWAESCSTPSSTKASDISSTLSTRPSSGGGWITTRMGISKRLANSKSRWSWAGTLMTAPVPYPANTKFAIQMGIFSAVKGLMAYEPVNIPSFSVLTSVRTALSSLDMRCTNPVTCSRCSSVVNRGTEGCSGASTM
jgi:hypothetical protein